MERPTMIMCGPAHVRNSTSYSVNLSPPGPTVAAALWLQVSRLHSVCSLSYWSILQTSGIWQNLFTTETCDTLWSSLEYLQCFRFFRTFYQLFSILARIGRWCINLHCRSLERLTMKSQLHLQRLAYLEFGEQYEPCSFLRTWFFWTWYCFFFKCFLLQRHSRFSSFSRAFYWCWSKWPNYWQMLFW